VQKHKKGYFLSGGQKMGKRTTLKSVARAGIKLLDIFPEGQKMFHRLILIMLVTLFVLDPSQLKARAEFIYYKYYFKEMQPLELPKQVCEVRHC
jgi:hypothetical protein